RPGGLDPRPGRDQRAGGAPGRHPRAQDAVPGTASPTICPWSTARPSGRWGRSPRANPSSGTGSGSGATRATMAAAQIETPLRARRVLARRPAGGRVRRSDAAALFALIDRLARELHTPRLHRVLLTEDCNAALAQIPRLGPLGWYRNYLLLGLPELQARSPEELQPLLAHELGHLSRQHGRLGAWIYRIRATWMRLAMMVEVQSQWGRPLFDWFLERWWPYFNAYSFVLAREREYEADRFAASIAGQDSFA